MSENVPVPAVVAQEIPFHVGHDVAIFHPNGGTVFFKDFRHFWDGSPKRFPEECNVQGDGGAFPAGTVKKLIGVSVQVRGAQDDDLFEVDVLHLRQLQRTLTIRSGAKEAVYLDPPLKIVGGESFEVHVRAPERLRTERAYARVSLHGSYSITGGAS